jgi:UDP-glucose 4-epimerase
VTTVGITGASGFLGSHLVMHAVEADVEVRALTRTLSGEHREAARLQWVQGDLGSPRDCERFLDGVDVIVHLAHVNTPLTSNAHLPADAAANLVPSLTLLQQIRESGTRPHLVLASSGGAVYRPRSEQVPIDEEAETAPSTSYGIQKLALEQYLRMAAAEGWLTATVLRIGNAYGTLLPRERLQGFIGVALNYIVHGEPVRIFGDWDNVRDYVHLDDLSRAMMLAAGRPEGFALYNIGSGAGHSVRQIMALLESIVGRPVPLQRDAPTPAAERLVSWVVLDNRRARRSLGWEPRVALEEGLRRLWEEVRAQ